MIKIGTSGFSYDDWKGRFYPADIKQSQMLSYYAGIFDCVELNFTYYRLPTEGQMEKMVTTTNGRVDFAVKAHKDITHERSPLSQDICKQFLAALKPLVRAHVLGAILLQFPHSFVRNPANERYLRTIRNWMPDIDAVIEFRHRSWINDSVLDLVRSLSFGICCVDEPALPGLMPPRADVTSRIGYARLHGRNAEKWWKHEQAWERYHYLYSEEVLREWTDRLRAMDRLANTVYLFANNHYQGNAATNAQMMKDLLGIAAAPPVSEPRQQAIDLDAYDS